ncbi:MAG: VWA domain-containing protein [Granulosicoccus sp.]|nr:VWA domain-containing protein [Granulosicoccus sp.]
MNSKTSYAKGLSLVLFVIMTLAVASSQAQNEVSDQPLYIIFDGSNSMWGELPDKSRKIAAAKDVFNSLDPAAFSNRELALRLYGHRRAGDCSDTQLAVPFSSGPGALANISKQINGVSPKGKTPISRSLTAALEDFAGRSGDIMLISDGIETCDVDPCELVQSWRDRNINIRVHVVGLGLSDVSRTAMQCIAEASGTTYLDANSIGDLVTSITIAATQPPVGEPNPSPSISGPEFKISGEDENGNYVPVRGTITGNNITTEEVASNRRYVFEGGTYALTAGVPTVNNILYEPIRKQIDISATGTTKIIVVLKRPPTIRTRFIENDEEVRGVIASAYQSDQEVFRLRPGEDYFVMPGTYHFKAALNKDNKLETTETLQPGDDRDIVFEAIETVHTTFVVVAQGQSKKLRQHQELWQDGELKYKVHVHNGAVIRPGAYTLKSKHPLTGYEIKDVEVPASDNQTLEFSIPAGVARINYQFVNQPDRDGRRCWLYPVNAQGELAKNRSSGLRCDGQDIALTEGRYFVLPWSYLGEFDDTYFDVVAGQTTEVVVQQKKLSD